MYLYNVDFKAVYPVGGALVIIASDIVRAREISREILAPYNIKDFEVELVNLDIERVVVFNSGDYWYKCVWKSLYISNKTEAKLKELASKVLDVSLYISSDMESKITVYIWLLG